MSGRPDSRGTDWEVVLEQALRDSRAAVPPVLFFEERVDLRIEAIAGRPPDSVHSLWRGLAARGRGGEGPVAYRSDPSPEDALRLARLASDPAVRHPRAWPRGEPGGRVTPRLPERELEAAIARLTGLLARHHPRAEIRARGVAFEQRVVVARAGRPPAADIRRSARLRLACRLRGAETAAVAEIVLPRQGEAGPGELERAAEDLARRAEALADAREAPRGQLPVVLAPGIGGVLVHEIVGHALEADRVLAGDSWLGQFEEPVAHPALLVIDDPRRGRAAWRVDDEGEPSRATPLIRDGRVADWLHDLRTARQAGSPPTGHGRCSTYRDPVQPRMGCTFVAPGKSEPDELLRDLRKGIYVRRMEAGTTDPRRGRAVFRATDSDLVRDGRIEAPLRPHLLFVDGARVLAGAGRMANDLAFDSCIGSCHREGQALAISVGAPTMWIGFADVSA